jgi:hypothetical protein
MNDRFVRHTVSGFVGNSARGANTNAYDAADNLTSKSGMAMGFTAGSRSRQKTVFDPGALSELRECVESATKIGREQISSEPRNYLNRLLL